MQKPMELFFVTGYLKKGIAGENMVAFHPELVHLYHECIFL